MVPERKGTLYLKHTQIVIHWTDGRAESFRLSDVTRIGRGRNGNDVAVPEVFQSVSRRHLEIRSEKDGYRIIDLGSHNGVKDSLGLNYGNEQLTGSWAALIWMSILSLLGTWSLLRRQN